MIQQAEAVLAEATAGDIASIVGMKILLNVAGVPWEVGSTWLWICART